MIRIAVAEDQAMVLGALAALLSLEDDIEVVGRAGDGEAAWRMVNDASPDVLVTDIEMPLLDGLEVAARIKEAGLPTRVLIVTTFGRPGYLRRAMDAGDLARSTRSCRLPGQGSDSARQALSFLARRIALRAALVGPCQGRDQSHGT